LGGFVFSLFLHSLVEERVGERRSKVRCAPETATAVSIQSAGRPFLRSSAKLASEYEPKNPAWPESYSDFTRYASVTLRVTYYITTYWEY
jgi:hypothetical protein